MIDSYSDRNLPALDCAAKGEPAPGVTNKGSKSGKEVKKAKKACFDLFDFFAFFASPGGFIKGPPMYACRNQFFALSTSLFAANHGINPRSCAPTSSI